MNILDLFIDNILEDKLSKFLFRSVCIKLESLRINLYKEVALSFKKVGDPILHISSWYVRLLNSSAIFDKFDNLMGEKPPNSSGTLFYR